MTKKTSAATWKDVHEQHNNFLTALNGAVQLIKLERQKAEIATDDDKKKSLMKVLAVSAKKLNELTKRVESLDIKALPSPSTTVTEMTYPRYLEVFGYLSDDIMAIGMLIDQLDQRSKL